MIFRGYFVQIYRGTTTAKPILASQFLLLFFPPSPVTVDTVTFKEHIFESDQLRSHNSVECSALFLSDSFPSVSCLSITLLCLLRADAPQAI